MPQLLLVAGALLVLGALLLGLAARGRRAAGLPGGRLAYQDGQGERETLRAPRYGLSGRPDYLVHTHSGLVPVEVKSGPCPARPREGHRLQLAAYCLLVEEAYGTRPPYGVIQYADRTIRIDYDERLRSELLDTLAEMRGLLANGEAPDARRPEHMCRACGQSQNCRAM